MANCKRAIVIILDGARIQIGFGSGLVRLARGEVILDTLKAADGSPRQGKNTLAV